MMWKRKPTRPDPELVQAKARADEAYQDAAQQLHYARSLAGITTNVMGAVKQSREKNHVREHLHKTFGGTL